MSEQDQVRRESRIVESVTPETDFEAESQGESVLGTELTLLCAGGSGERELLCVDFLSPIHSRVSGLALG